jgi:hypothetical protein
MRELLLLLCRYPYEEKDRDLLSKLIGEVQDWQKLVELIIAHGIIALAAYNIKEAGLIKEVPEEAMSILENGYMKNVVRNLWLTERWKEVNTILTNAGIKHVLLKGMALEHTLYGSKGLRQMTDNDILVKCEDALNAWNLLKQNGFTRTLIKSPLHARIQLDIGKHLPCLYKDDYSVEIHHKLFGNNFNIDKINEDPINDALEISIGETRAWILPAKLQLMYLIDHYVRHTAEGYCQLRLYADIVLLDKTSDLRIPDSFILKPQQGQNKKSQKTAYKTNFNSIPPKVRLRFLIGDTFPSLQWMKKRYKCNGLIAILHYPLRLGKLMWLI